METAIVEAPCFVQFHRVFYYKFCVHWILCVHDWCSSWRCRGDMTETTPCHVDTQCLIYVLVKGKGKAIPLQAWTGHEGSRSLKLPDFKTIGT